MEFGTKLVAVPRVLAVDAELTPRISQYGKVHLIVVGNALK